jgi:hypothetical protein
MTSLTEQLQQGNLSPEQLRELIRERQNKISQLSQNSDQIKEALPQIRALVQEMSQIAEYYRR